MGAIGIESLPIVQLIAPVATLKTTSFAVAGILFYKVRKVWDVARHVFAFFTLNDLRLKIDTNPLKRRALGYFGQCLWGQNEMYRVCARAVYMAATAALALDRTQKLAVSVAAWKMHAFAGTHSTAMSKKTNLLSSSFINKLLGPSNAFWVKHNLSATAFRVKNIAFYGFIVLKDAFLVSMAYADAFRAYFSWDSDSGREANISVIENLHILRNHSGVLTSTMALTATKYGFNGSTLALTAGTILNGYNAVYDKAAVAATKVDNGIGKTLRAGANVLYQSMGLGAFGTPDALVT